MREPGHELARGTRAAGAGAQAHVVVDALVVAPAFEAGAAGHACDLASSAEADGDGHRRVVAAAASPALARADDVAELAAAAASAASALISLIGSVDVWRRETG